jgi:hypothetical protein
MTHQGADAEFERHKSRGVAARPRQAIHEAGSGTSANAIGTLRAAWNNGSIAALPEARMTVMCRPAVVDPRAARLCEDWNGLREQDLQSAFLRQE